jgi:ADP-ribose pyrophosphatase
MSDLTVAPWTTTDSRLAYAHRTLVLFVDQTLDPAGAPRIRHRLIEADSTRVVAVDADGQLALVWHWRYTLGYPAIELPSAPVQPDEDPRAAAGRALRDGCGLAARTWTRIGTTTLATEVAAQTVHLYRAAGLHRATRPAGEGQLLAFAMPYPVAVASAVAGAIQDAARVTDLLHAEQQRLAGDWQPPNPRRPRPHWPHRV